MAQIQVSEYVKSELDDIKQIEEHKSYDSVLRALVSNYDYGE